MSEFYTDLPAGRLGLAKAPQIAVHGGLVQASGESTEGPSSGDAFALPQSTDETHAHGAAARSVLSGRSVGACRRVSEGR